MELQMFPGEECVPELKLREKWEPSVVTAAPAPAVFAEPEVPASTAGVLVGPWVPLRWWLVARAQQLSMEGSRAVRSRTVRSRAVAGLAAICVREEERVR